MHVLLQANSLTLDACHQPFMLTVCVLLLLVGAVH
jgi:hypothetical protein